MQEECRQWDVNEIVFSPAMWGSYHHLMRSDFTLFDEYKFTAAGRSRGCACVGEGGGRGLRLHVADVWEGWHGRGWQ